MSKATRSNKKGNKAMTTRVAITTVLSRTLSILPSGQPKEPGSSRRGSGSPSCPPLLRVSENIPLLGSSVNRGNPPRPLTASLFTAIVTVGATHEGLWVFEPLGKRRKEDTTDALHASPPQSRGL